MMKKILSFLLAATMLLSLAISANAASFSPATRDPAEIEQIRAAAANGDPNALAALGNAYYLGDYTGGISRDFKAALDCFIQAAAAGNTDVLINIGTIYEKGSAGERNINKAYEYYKQALDAGKTEAEEKLASPLFADLRWKDNLTVLKGTLGEDMTIAGTNRVATPFFLDAPVENCTMIAMDLRVISVDTGWPWGQYALYAWGLDGQWQNLGYFQIEREQANGETRTYGFQLPSPVSFKALAVVLAEDGMEFILTHEDTFSVDKTLVTSYSDMVPAPTFTPSDREYPRNSASVAMSAWSAPTGPAGLYG